MKQLSLMIDLDRCIGCGTCIVACRNYHEIVDHTRAKPNEMPYYLRIESYRTGCYPDVQVDTWVVPCQHCHDPQCVVSCPEGAISKAPGTGIVNIDRNMCNGCEATLGLPSIEKQLHAPCKVNCPANINVQGYVALAAKGKYQEALRLIKQDNPLPAVCGRVCHRPCESVCNRGLVDEPVAIASIRRFVADLDLNSETRYVPKIKRQRKDKAAIIGSGPAGLSCAYYLAIEGYQVTIYEKMAMAGGMLTTAIPEYRLPGNIIEAEIQVIRDMGVEIKTGVDVGRDITIEQLRKEGVKAIFLAVGSQECKKLEIEGEDLEGVYPGLDLLREMKAGRKRDLGKRVAVIGGGNVALDAVRTARRLGADQAFIIYRRSLEEMPASQEEIEECREEGIEINFLTHPTKIIGANGKATAIQCVKMTLGEPDESGRRLPTPIEGSEFVMEVDSVIPAIGQESDWACLGPECACTLTEWGTMNVDPVTLQTDDPDIFAGGDAVTGPRTVIEAIEAGKQAALSMDRFIRGVDLRKGRQRTPQKTSTVTTEGVERIPRVKMPRLSPQTRVNHFDEVQQGFTEEMVAQEAKRCLHCGSACLQACPYGVIQFAGEEGKAHKCNLCSDRVHCGELPVCAEVCLTDAIAFGEYELLKQTVLDEQRSIDEDLSKESLLYTSNADLK